MGDFKLEKSDIDTVVNNVNTKEKGYWTWTKLGDYLQEELSAAIWEKMLYRDNTTKKSFDKYKDNVKKLIIEQSEIKFKIFKI